MPDLPLGDGMQPLPRYCVVEVGRAPEHTRRVALLGLNTEDRTILRADAFGGATIEPLLASAEALYREIMAKEKDIDAIIPLTHQLMPLDRILAEKRIGFPVIIGGHDHDVYMETVAGCQIVKTGINAEHIAVCDLTWRDQETCVPEVTVRLHDAAFYPPDPAVSQLVQRHKRVLKELEKAVLCVIPPSFSLSSVGIRLDPVTMGTFMCSVVRDALSVDCCLISAGNIRGNRDYSTSKVICAVFLIFTVFTI
jgi:2',3'-cyclic-nucleotide 2'-phosphodiesterase (5'-nucleotidase family)